MDLKKHLQLMADLGSVVTASGQLSYRDCNNPAHWWTTALGSHDLICLDIKGNLVHGSGPVNFAAQSFHSAIYKSRTDVNAVAHFHTDNTVAWSILQKPLIFSTQESGLFYSDISHAAIPGLLGNANADIVVKELSTNNTLIVYNHGPITVGKTIESALWRTILLDKICELNLKAMAVGKVQELDSRTIRQCHKFFAKELVMQYQYNNFKQQYGL